MKDADFDNAIKYSNYNEPKTGNVSLNSSHFSLTNATTFGRPPATQRIVGGTGNMQINMNINLQLVTPKAQGTSFTAAYRVSGSKDLRAARPGASLGQSQSEMSANLAHQPSRQAIGDNKVMQI